MTSRSGTMRRTITLPRRRAAETQAVLHVIPAGSTCSPPPRVRFPAIWQFRHLTSPPPLSQEMPYPPQWPPSVRDQIARCCRRPPTPPAQQRNTLNLIKPVRHVEHIAKYSSFFSCNRRNVTGAKVAQRKSFRIACGKAERKCRIHFANFNIQPQ